MTITEQLKVPRALHPAAWWLWAALVASACSRVNNLLALLAMCLVASAIAYSRQYSLHHWRVFTSLTSVAIGVVVVRLLLQLLFGAPVGADVLLRIPVVHLPDWLSGVRIGGVITASSVTTAMAEALRIVATIVVLAAAAATTSATRLLRSLPSSFHTFGMLVIIAGTFIPHIFQDVARIQSAHRWRGSHTGRLRTLATNIVSVCSAALDRSVALAGSMTTRGYSTARPALQHLNRGFFLLATSLGLLLAAPNWKLAAILCAALGICLIGMHIYQSEKNATRTRYRNELWRSPESIVVISGVMVVLLWSYVPLAAIFAAALPLVFTPELPALRGVMS